MRLSSTRWILLGRKKAYDVKGKYFFHIHREHFCLRTAYVVYNGNRNQSIQKQLLTNWITVKRILIHSYMTDGVGHSK